ncbi:MAG TPA: hypothetical protein VMV48_12145 [Gallionellaceae bacterium]|nr:hypothetical protein [Gallionellaceae bacterium]
MDILLFWLPLVASILLGGFAASAWYGGDKILGLWSVFAGVVFLLITGTIQIHQNILGAESAKVTEAVPDKATVLAQRAYVTVSDAEVSDLTNPTAPTVAVIIKNTGATPAYDLTWRAIFAAREFPATDDIVLDRTKEAPKIVLAPGNVLSYKWTFDHWEKGWNSKITKGNSAIFAVGEISYKDAFGNIRSTKYRLIHGGDSMVSKGKFGPDKKGNEAD